MAVAVFDYTAWVALYPELAAAVPQTRAAALFVQAGIYLDNTDASVVADPVLRLALLNMIVAHLATRGKTLNADGTLTPTGIVGRVSSASEGSVSVSTDTGAASGTAAWWAQTTYGFDYWAATAQFRRGFYATGPTQVIDPPYAYSYMGGVAWPR